jgi:hypothetical protein
VDLQQVIKIIITLHNYIRYNIITIIIITLHNIIVIIIITLHNYIRYNIVYNYVQ